MVEVARERFIRMMLRHMAMARGSIVRILSVLGANMLKMGRDRMYRQIPVTQK